MISKSEDFYAPLLLERWIQTEASGGICSGVLRVSPIFQQIYPTHFHPMFHFCQNSGPMGHSRYVAGILPFIRSFTELPTIPKRPACQNAKQSWYFKIYQNFLSVDKGKQINCYCIQKYIGKQHI